MRTSPCKYDGKKVGAKSHIITLREPRPGPRWGRGLRREAYYGSVDARRKLAAHARKWISRGMRPDHVAKKLGLTLVEVAQWMDIPPFDPTPRLRHD